MKKKILFVIESLVCAGGERSLVTLLNLFDYEKYDVDLQLFSYGGELEELLPPEVRLLPPVNYYSNLKKSLFEQFRYSFQKKGGFGLFFSRLKYSIVLRIKKMGSFQQAIEFWKCAGSLFERREKEYDIAVAYAQCTPTFYVADCIKAKKKIAWINAIYEMEGKYKLFSEEKYSIFDRISCVSEESLNAFAACFPMFANKLRLTKDIVDPEFINRLSMAESDAEKEMNDPGVKILTVGRFAWPKGYDIAVKACAVLKNRGQKIKWYVLGRGSYESIIREQIRECNVEDCMILLGVRANPYPYYRQADIYVQTSRKEGFGLAIAEARMLNVPVVTTRFDAVFAQMADGENGLVVDMNAEAVADGIERLINDKALYDHIVEYQSKEKKGNTEEIEKFYKLIEE